MNVLQIEIFRGSIFYVINSIQEIEAHILLSRIEAIIEQMKQVTLDNDIKIQMLCHVEENRVVINKDNPAQLMIYNFYNNTIHGEMIHSIDAFEREIVNLSKKEKKYETIDREMNINKYDCLVFSKKVFQQICEVTQQFLNYKEISLDKSFTICVQTSMGTESLFDNGRSKKIQNQITDIIEWKGLPKRNIDDFNALYVVNLNNFISSICIDTGEYTMSLKVYDEKEKKYTILHLKCMIANFWLNLCEAEYREKMHVLFSK